MSTADLDGTAGTEQLAGDAATAEAARLARHGVLYTAAAIVQGLSTVLVLPFALRVLGRVEYGHIAVSLSIIQVGTILAVAGLPLAITRAYFDEDRGPERGRGLLGLLVLTAVVVTAVASAVIHWWPSGGPHPGLTPTLAAIWSVGAVSVVAGGQAIMRAVGRPILFAAVAIGSTVGAHLVGLVLAAFDPRAVTYMLGYFLGALATALVTLLIARPASPWRVPGAVREGLAISLPVLPHSVALLTLTSGDPILVANLLGTTDAGRYQTGMLLGSAPLALLAGLNNAWAPAVLGTPAGERAANIARTSRGLVALAVAFAVGVALAVPVAIRVLASAQTGLDEIVQLAQIISLCVLGQVVYLITSVVLFAEKRTRPLAVITPVSAAAAATFALLVAPAHGLAAVAVAKVIGFVLMGAGCWIASRRLLVVPWRYAELGALLAAGAVVVGVTLLLPQRPVVMGVELGLAVLLGLVVLRAVARAARHRPDEVAT